MWLETQNSLSNLKTGRAPMEELQIRMNSASNRNRTPSYSRGNTFDSHFIDGRNGLDLSN
jgi:hypothetical protein